MPESGRREKSTVVMFSFLLGICFSAIFVLCYGVLTGVLYQYCSLPGPDLVNSLLHSVLISAVGTALCCLFFFLRRKELVPYGFLWMTFFVIVAYMFTLFHFDGGDRTNLLTALSLFCLAPVLVGNGVSWLLLRRFEGRMY